MNEELDSQLSAMFDDELPAAECELLARRLSRDEQLKARWGRYAVIGAAIRAERGVRLNAGLAGRVSQVISTEPTLGTANPVPRARRGLSGWWQPAAGIAVAASVATLAILWMRSQSLPEPGVAPSSTVVASSVSPRTAVPAPMATSNTPGTSDQDSYVVPRNSERLMVVPSTELANYVVAHSEVSSPVARRNLLSAFMVSESGTAGTSTGSEEPAPSEDVVQDDAKSTP